MGGMDAGCAWRAGAVLLLVGILPSQPVRAVDARQVFAQVAPSVLVLEPLDEAGTRLGAHTAIAVGAEEAVSACDVLDGAHELIVRAGDRPLKAQVKRRDAQRNLCLLAVPDLAGPVGAPGVADGLPAAGEHVYAVSNALGLGVGISEGMVSGIRSFGSDRYIQFTAPVSPGSEGGALIDARGRLLGVIDYRHRDGQNVNFAAPAQWIREIEARSAADDGRQQLRDRAARLGREEAWPELAVLAQEWTGRHAEDIDGWRWLGTAAFMRKDLDTEERAWREMRRIDPARVAAGVGLAQVLLKRGQARESLELARSLLAFRREDADIWLAIGRAERALKNPDGAEYAFRQAISFSPWSIGAHEGMVRIAEGRSDWAAAAAAWSRLAQLLPDVAQVQLGQIDNLVRDNRPAQALPIVERLLEREPQNGDAWYSKGFALWALGRPADAGIALRRSLDKAPSNPAAVWGTLGETLFGLRLFPESIRAYREAVRLAPDNRYWRFWLAVVLKDGGYLDEAIALDEAMTVERPDDFSGWRQLGFARAMAGQTEGAAQALERSLNLEPKQGKVWVALLECYHATGRKDDFKRAYEKLRGIDSAWAETAYKSLILPYEEAR